MKNTTSKVMVKPAASAASPNYVKLQGRDRVGCEPSLQEDQKNKIQGSLLSPVVRALPAAADLR